MRKRTNIVAAILILLAIGALWALFSTPTPVKYSDASRLVEREVAFGESEQPEPEEKLRQELPADEPGPSTRAVKKDTIEIIAGDRDAKASGYGTAAPGEARDARRSRARMLGKERLAPKPRAEGKAERGIGLSDRLDTPAKEAFQKRAASKDLESALNADIFGSFEESSPTPGRKGPIRQPRQRAPQPPRPRVVPKVPVAAKPVITEPQMDEFEGFENRAQEQESKVSSKMTETAVDPMSTFSIDVDTAGYTLARARLREGYRPKPENVRIEEFLNYFQYDYADPKDGEFSVHLEAAPDPLAVGASKKHLIRIGVKGRSVPDDARPPAHLTFLIDVSGSMFGPDRLGLVIEALDLVTRNLRPDDTIALVTYAKGAHVRLWPAGAAERDIVASTIASLEPGGSSALDEGLRLSYQVAATHFYAGHINRVVLIGDGRANVGQTKPDALLAGVREGVEDGVMLSTIGFGSKSFNDQMMERLADRGNGSYFFVDSYREAQKVFKDRLCGTLFTIAKDVKIQVEFDPTSVLRHRLLGYENRRLEHKQFRDDAVDAGEVGAGHSVTALYEVELAPEPGRTLATVHIRYKKPDEDSATESTYELFSTEVVTDVREASPDFKFAAAVAMFAQIARGDVPAGADRISLIQEIASEGVSDPERQPDREEFIALLGEASPYYAK